MKRIYFLLWILLMSCGIATAQLNANRTATTKIADALAQLPAQSQSEYNRIMDDLLSTGEDGVLSIIKMMNPPGKGSNAPFDYALSGLSRYATGEGKEKDRTMLANAYCKALTVTSEKATKAFIIRQLTLVGKDESVESLKKVLNDDDLSAPASKALASIQTPNALKALSEALSSANANNKKNIVNALASTESPTVEKSLQPLVGRGDKDMEKDVLFALSHCGTKASLPILAKAAEKAGYTMEPTGANEAYIALMKRVLKQGDAKDAGKAASDLLKNAEKAKQTQTRDAALDVLLASNPKNKEKEILNALNDPDREYRNVALFYASASDSKLASGITGKLKKADLTAKIDILNWLGNQREKSALPVIQPYLDNDNLEVATAAAIAIIKIGDESSIGVLTNLLKSRDSQKIALGKMILPSIKGNINPGLVDVLKDGPNAGKVAALSLLSDRKADEYSNEVFSRLSDSNPVVADAAYDALKGVVKEKDLPQLYRLLESANNVKTIVPLQQAVTAAVSSQPKEQQFKTITAQMKNAGERNEYLYYIVLANTGQKQALPIILDGLNNRGIAKESAYNAYLLLISSPTYSPENKVIFLRDLMPYAKTDDKKIEILKQIGNAGTFEALIYCGSYLDNMALQQTAANAVMNIALNHPEYTGDIVRNLLTQTIAVLNNPDAEYQKQAIKKHLAEMPNGKGFVSLFNGKDLTGWKGLVENPIARAKMKPAELKAAQEKANLLANKTWIIEDGCLVFTGKGDNLCTDKQYGDFEMYIDWKLFQGPEPDAGIYLRGTPQVQIWDTARVNVGAEVGSGGLYNNAVNPSKPLKVADNQVGQWNTFYIKMVGERVTVYLNGELVVDNVILENYWDRKQPIFSIEQIELQAHGSKVAYRDIYIKEIEQVKPYQLSAEEKKDGFQVLFDGLTMNQWTGNTTNYTPKDGCIVLDPLGSSGGNLYTKKEYSDFIYRFDFQLTPAANNGIGIRTPLEGDAAYVGMEIQVLDSEAPVYKDLHDYQYHGSVYGIIPAKRGYLKPTGEWNSEEIIAEGDHIKVTLNGVVILDGNIREATKNGTPDHKEHPGLFNKTGHIGFLGHDSEVKFRNIRVKELNKK